jgi:hypothetical protein
VAKSSAAAGAVAQPAGEVDAELVFNGEVSPRAVAGFARSGESLDVSDAEETGLVIPGSAELRGNGLMNTISALQSRPPRSAHALGLPWADDADETDLSSFDIPVADAAAAGVAGRDNVLIPLPLASWSALSVLGGVGFVAGLRRMARRFR